VVEIGIAHISAGAGLLITALGVLWKIIDSYSKRERSRHDKTDKELAQVREKHIELLGEVSNIKRERDRQDRTEKELEGVRQRHDELMVEVAQLRGSIKGQRELSNLVLTHISSLAGSPIEKFNADPEGFSS
jgi:hypothetical protein